MILFTSRLNSGISLISAAGGEPREVTSLDLSSRETAHRWPRFLPDGRHFTYLAESPQERAIYVGSLDSRERKRIAAAQSAPVYAAAPAGPGHLLFLRNGALMAQRFDPGRAATLAEPVQVPELVSGTLVGYYGMLMVSASDNGVLAYRRSGVAGTQLAWFDRSGRRLNNLGEPGLYSNPAISPDGKKVAVCRAEAAAGTRDIWVYDLARETASRFTFNPGDNSNPA